MRNQSRYQTAYELSEYLKGLQSLFENMNDGPVEHLQAFQMVQLLKPATEKIEILVKAER